MRSKQNQILNRNRSSTRLQETQAVTSDTPQVPAKACSTKEIRYGFPQYSLSLPLL
jgi:hypothetical protein